MIVETLLALLGAIVVSSLVSIPVRGNLATFGVQLFSMAALAYIVYNITGMLLPSVLVLLWPFIAGLLSIIILKYMKRRALQGAFGEESQWAAELAESDDEEFKMAVKGLSDIDLREVGIIADSKEDLREETVKRYRESQSED